MESLYCKHSSKAGVKAVKFVSAENNRYTTKYIHMCETSRRSEPQPPEWRLSSTVDVCLHTATADRQVTLAEQVEAAAMRSSAQTQDKHDTGHVPKGRGAVWRGRHAAGVYVNVCGICLYACP